MATFTSFTSVFGNNVTSVVNTANILVSCDEVIAQRSLFFTLVFLAILYLSYLVTALAIYASKHDLRFKRIFSSK